MPNSDKTQTMVISGLQIINQNIPLAHLNQAVNIWVYCTIGPLRFKQMQMTNKLARDEIALCPFRRVAIQYRISMLKSA